MANNYGILGKYAVDIANVLYNEHMMIDFQT
jgi:hypothetical protein